MLLGMFIWHLGRLSERRAFASLAFVIVLPQTTSYRRAAQPASLVVVTADCNKAARTGRPIMVLIKEVAVSGAGGGAEQEAFGAHEFGSWLGSGRLHELFSLLCCVNGPASSSWLV